MCIRDSNRRRSTTWPIVCAVWYYGSSKRKKIRFCHFWSDDLPRSLSSLADFHPRKLTTYKTIQLIDLTSSTVFEGNISFFLFMNPHVQLCVYLSTVILEPVSSLDALLLHRSIWWSTSVENRGQCKRKCSARVFFKECEGITHFVKSLHRWARCASLMLLK